MSRFGVLLKNMLPGKKTNRSLMCRSSAALHFLSVEAYGTSWMVLTKTCRTTEMKWSFANVLYVPACELLGQRAAISIIWAMNLMEYPSGLTVSKSAAFELYHILEKNMVDKL